MNNFQTKRLNKIQKNFFENYVEKELHYLKHPLHKYQIEKRYSHAMKMAKLSKKDTVLEIGCGTGFQILAIKKKCKIYYGVDFSRKAIAVCKKKYGKSRAKFFLANAEKLPFKEEFFDIIFLIDTFSHFVFPEKILKEVKRVLKPTGRLVISVQNENSFFGILKKIFPTQAKAVSPLIDRWYDKISIAKFLTKNDFRIIDVRGSFFLPPF